MSATTRSNDRGFTLIELLIGAALTVVVITVIGGVLVSSLRADTTVRSVTESTTNGQLVVNTIEATVRNAAEIEYTLMSDCASSFVHAALGPATSREYRAWFYDASTDALAEARSTDPIPAPTPGSDAFPGSIVVMKVGILAGRSSVFSAQDSQGLNVAFTVDSNGGPQSYFDTTFTARNTNLEIASSPCSD